jgi:hypothetical protein
MALPEDPRPSRIEDPDIRVTRTDHLAPLTRVDHPVYLSVRWPGVWTGLFIAMGVLVILTALGVAVGATTVSNSGTTQALSKGAAWWGGISFLIALFIGGAVAARWVTGGLTSVLQGALVWVLAVVAVLYLAGTGISLGAQGLFAAMGTPGLNSAMEQMANNMGQVASQVGTTGTVNTAQSVAPTAWITFIVLCVSAIAAIIGAIVGRQKEVRPLV